MSTLADWMTRPAYNDDRSRVVWSPPLPRFDSNGARGYLRLAAVHETFELEPIGNPYAAGLVDVPDAGGYNVFAVTDDGAALCHRCVIDPANPVHPADPADRYPDGWGIVAWSHDGDEDGPVTCGHCSAEIIADPDAEEVGR